jgi:hypothetical protein
MSVRIIARQITAPGRVWWVAGLIQHKGHPFVDRCDGQFASRGEALDYANGAYRHCDPGSMIAETIEKFGGLAD